ncbi:MAG: hypothetical protein IKL85_09265, partial [Lentisphaeria bacterium]|nr:hypothetical protein [Lentisphaeria bacterium]
CEAANRFCFHFHVKSSVGYFLVGGESCWTLGGNSPDTKKAGRIPIRVYEGPTKNLPLNDRETPSKTRRHNGPCWFISIQRQKVIWRNLVGFRILLLK